MSTTESARLLSYSDFVRRVAYYLGIEDETEAMTAPEARYLGLHDELEFDSMQVFELVVIAEALAGSMTPPPDEREVNTLGDAYEHYVATVEWVTQSEGA